MSAAPTPKRLLRPATPILDAWRREMRRRYGDPVPAAAIAEQVGAPTWIAAAWEAAALRAWSEGASEATVTSYLLRPYQTMAAAIADEVVRQPAELAFLDQVRHARRPLSARDRMRVLQLAERAAVNEATG